MTKYHMTSKIVGQKIKQLRKSKQLTISQLGEMVGVSEQQQSRYERGINRIDVEKLYLFSQVFGVNMAIFFNDLELSLVKPYKYSDIKHYYDSECII